jgi:hypothetical protein
MSRAVKVRVRLDSGKAAWYNSIRSSWAQCVWRLLLYQELLPCHATELT